jgi:glutathione S-transferase
MLTLCGFSASNYYNKVKLALLEKEVPFQEKLMWVDRSPALLEKSPLGKVPFFEIGDKVLFESQVMLDYVEAAYPQKPLLPSDSFEAARIRELIQYMELHLELVARELYGEAFFGGKIADETKTRLQKQLKRNIAAFGRVAKFSPYIAGSEFTMADCAATVHLPLIAMATKAIYGEDMMADYPVRDYLKLVGDRPTVQKVTADRKLNAAALSERIKSQSKT